MAAIASAGLTFLDNTSDPTLLKEIIEGEGGRQAAQMQSQTQYLLDIAVIAPMLGLLGTVLGMMQAFNAVALDIARARPMVLADGVSKALVTTAAGLFIGIPAMAFYAFFRGRVSRLVALLESHSADLVVLLSNRKAR
jgi:biopolymer transport protein ExbB